MKLTHWTFEKQRQWIPWLIFAITAIFSVGFLHPDEHFQVLEFLNLKLPGRYVDMKVFHWDYHEAMRSWTQPFLYYLVARPLNFLDGFQLAFLFRLLNGFLLLGGLRLFAQSLGEDKKSVEQALLYTALIWFVPFLAVRTSSESLSTSFFFFGYYFYQNKKPAPSIVFWSLSFLTRYQMGVLIAPLMIWDFFKKKIQARDLLIMYCLLLPMLLAGFFIDFWGYGRFELAPWNYLYQNVVLGKASNFGVEPFYYYLWKPLSKGIPPVSLFVFGLGAKYLWDRRSSSLTVGVLCFVLIHSLLGHKELRFLTPVYFIFALCAVLEFFKHFAHHKKAFQGVMLISLLVMAKTSLTPATSRTSFYKVVQDFTFGQVYVPKSDKIFVFDIPFYMNREIQTTVKSEFLNPPFDYTYMTSSLKELHQVQKQKHHCSMIYTQYPLWIEHFNFFHWLNRSSFHVLWTCRAQGK